MNCGASLPTSKSVRAPWGIGFSVGVQTMSRGSHSPSSLLPSTHPSSTQGFLGVDEEPLGSPKSAQPGFKL